MNDLNLLQQLYARFIAKSPKLFKVITTVSMIAAFITGIPELLDLLGVQLPDSIQFFASKTIAIATLVAAFIAKLTVATPETKTVLQDINTSGTSPQNHS